ncbi:MAG TPA: hypothetical protein VGZ22_26050, partial [Isosphaeraceae bacterium]|nr:hypothetical protein [Isosphaeraceae bacterium]
MSRQELIRANAAQGSPHARLRTRGWGLAVAGMCAFASPAARAQEAPATVTGMPAAPAGVASVASDPAAAVATLPSEVQVIKFRVPEGVTVEVLGPPPEPLQPGEARTGAMFGFRVGVGYRLRLGNLPERPGVQLYPVVEVVGHLHRPAEVDPLKFPIRVALTDLDLEDVVDRGRLVTHVVYIEDPEQALPIAVPKDQIPVVTLTPAEEPLRVATALGRAMAILRLGRRVPNPEEWSVGAGDVTLAPSPCPFSTPAGGRCGLPLGFACGTAPPRGQIWLPRDEYLCDGGDHGEVVHFGGDGGLRGIDPRDAVIRFQANFRPR